MSHDASAPEGGQRAFQFSSFLPGVAAVEVWDQVGRWAGVNDELGPVIKMTFPDRYAKIDEIPADGTSHFTSTILFFGVLPIDRHRFVLKDIEAPHFFDEHSSTLMLRAWHHKRILTERDGGVEVEDLCALEPRLKIMGPLLLAIYRRIFQRRHRRLKASYGIVS